MKKAKNKLIIIGHLGLKTAYLNISKEEAIQRYIETEKSFPDDEIIVTENMIQEIEFNDEFSVYDAWK